MSRQSRESLRESIEQEQTERHTQRGYGTLVTRLTTPVSEETLGGAVERGYAIGLQNDDMVWRIGVRAWVDLKMNLHPRNFDFATQHSLRDRLMFIDVETHTDSGALELYARPGILSATRK